MRYPTIISTRSPKSRDAPRNLAIARPQNSGDREVPEFWRARGPRIQAIAGRQKPGDRVSSHQIFDPLMDPEFLATRRGASPEIGHDNRPPDCQASIDPPKSGDRRRPQYCFLATRRGAPPEIRGLTEGQQSGEKRSPETIVDLEIWVEDLREAPEIWRSRGPRILAIARPQKSGDRRPQKTGEGRARPQGL